MPALPCLYCGCISQEPLWKGVRDRLRFVPGEWAFVRCRECGSALLHPRPDPAQLASFYPQVYDLTPQAVNLLEYRFFFQPQYRAQARRIRRKTSGADRKKLLDLGCGGGLRLLALREAGFDVAGADFRAETVESIRTSFGIPAFALDINRPAAHLPPESYDVITAFHVVEHLADVESFLRGAHRLLKPGGCLIVTLPILDSLQGRFFGVRWAEATEAPRHLSIPSRKGLRDLMKRTGFSDPLFESETLWNSVGIAVLSALPVLGRRHGEGAGKKFLSAAAPIVAAVVAVAVLPLCVTAQILNQSGAAQVTARKTERAR